MLKIQIIGSNNPYFQGLLVFKRMCFTLIKKYTNIIFISNILI